MSCHPAGDKPWSESAITQLIYVYTTQATPGLSVIVIMLVHPWDAPTGQIHHDGYRKTSTISRTFVGNNIVDNSDVVGASPVGAAPTTSSFST